MEGAPHESHPSLKELPEELRPSGQLLVKALADGNDVAGRYADFCAKAYVKPDWAGAASEFLVELFDDHQDLLAEMTRIPDLIIELASGHLTLTCMVAYRWAAQSDTARLSKLAEALTATHSKMSDPEVVHIMLALVTALAITRYPRAEQMLNAAEPHVLPEHSEGLQEARAWLAAGRLVRSCGQKARDLWDHRLRRTRTRWTWESADELSALHELAEVMSPDQEGASLFEAILPGNWRALAAHWAAMNATAQESANVPEQEPQVRVRREIHPQPVVIWNAGAFFGGGLVGAAALALVIWLGPYDLKKSAPPEAVVPVVFADSNEKSADETPKEAPQEVWRREKMASMALEHADLKPLFDKTRSGSWTEHEKLLSGDSSELLKEDARYQSFLVWLHVDPPSDESIRAQLPTLLAKIQPNSDTLELWTHLLYEGSPMKTAIQEGAKRQLHENRDSWSASQELELRRIAWGS